MKREVLLHRAVLLACLTLSLSAQVRIAGPMLGYVYDADAKAIRLVSGVPGAAAPEAPIEAGGSVDRAWISRRGYAVVQGKQGSAMRFLNWNSGVDRELEDAVSAAISPSGQWFALLREGRAEIWDATPKLVRAFPVGAGNGIAVSDDGQAVLVVTAAGISLASEGGNEQKWSGEGIRSLEFFPNSRDFAATDAVRGKLLLVRSGATSEVDLAVTGPIAVTGNGRTVAVGGEAKLWLIDAATSSVVKLDTAQTPAALTRVSGDVLQVRFDGPAGDSGPLTLLDLSGAVPQFAILAPGATAVGAAQ